MTRRPAKRRRSRLARWVLRPAVWSVALLALLVFSSWQLAESDWFAGRLRKGVEERASEFLGRPVRIGELELRMVPLGAAVRGVTVAGEEPADAPFVEVDELRVDVQIESFLRPSATIRRLEIKRPVIRLEIDEAGRHNGPETVRRSTEKAAGRSLDLTVGFIEVVDGILELGDLRHEVSVTGTNVDVGLEQVGPVKLAGTVRADDVSFIHADSRPYLGSVSIFGSVEPGRAEISSAQIDAGDVTARVSGFWDWCSGSSMRFAIDAEGEIALLERLRYIRGQMAGSFDFDGLFTREAGVWSLAGTASSPGIVAFDRTAQSVLGRVVVDTEGLRFQVQRASYGGGGVTGAIRVARGSAEAPVELDLQIDGADLDYLLAEQKIPLEGFAGAVSGGLSYQFSRKNPQEGNGWADLRIAPHSGAKGIAVAGSAVFNIGKGVLTTEAIRLMSDRQLFLAEGSYEIPSKEGSFEFHITTSALAELLELLPLEDRAEVWRPHQGAGLVTGTVHLENGRPRIETELELSGLVASGFAAESAQGRFEVTPAGIEDLRIELLREEGGLIVTGAVGLPVSSEGAGLTIAVDAEAWPLAEAAAWLPFTLPVSGPFSGTVDVRSVGAEVEGRARGQVARARIGDLTVEGLDIDIAFSPDAVSFLESEVRVGNGSVRIYGSYHRDRDRFDLRADSDRLELASFPGLTTDSRLAGRVALHATLGGSMAVPELSLQLSAEDVALGSRVLGADGSGRLEVDWSGNEVEARGGIPKLIELTAGGRLDAEGIDLDVDYDSEDLTAVLGLFVERELPEFRAAAAGRVAVTGPLSTRSMALPPIEVRMDRLVVEYAGKELESVEPVEFTIDGGDVAIHSLFVAAPGEASELFLAGRLTPAENSLDLKVQSSLSAEWFRPWIPEGLRLEAGTLDVIGTIAGSFETPEFDGVGELHGGRVTSERFPATARDIHAVVLFYPRQMVLDSLNADLAGGTLRGAGVVRWDEEIPEYRFQLSGSDMSFRYPENWSIRTDSEITLASSPAGRQLTGALALERALYLGEVPIGLEQLLQALFTQRRVEVGGTDEWQSTTQLNLAVEADRTLRIRNSVADLRGTADLVLRGSLARPVVFGEVELEPSGRLRYSGNEYKIDRGLLTFANPYRLEPVIDLVARADLREYDVTLSASGTPDRLAFDFVSDPPLAELEVMALLTGGARPGLPTFDAKPTGAEEPGAEGFLYGQATSLVANRFNRLFGLDQFRIDPLTSSTGNLSSARVTVGKQLSRDLFATYSYDPSETEEQVLEVEWRVSRSLILVVTQNGDGSYAVDTKWEKVF